LPAEPLARCEARRLCAWFDDGFHREVTANLLYERVNKKLMGRGYPDSQKISIVTGQRGESGLRKMFRAESTVDYYDREGS
jgi:hypothetical protein